MVKAVEARVHSKKNDKTLTVLVLSKVEHKVYKKHLKTKTKLQVHDSLNIFGVGDLVKIVNCRPISKLKRWKVLYSKPLDDSIRNTSSSIRQ